MTIRVKRHTTETTRVTFDWDSLRDILIEGMQRRCPEVEFGKEDVQFHVRTVPERPGTVNLTASIDQSVRSDADDVVHN